MSDRHGINATGMALVKVRTHDERSLAFDPKAAQLPSNFTNEEGEQLLREAMGKIHEMIADNPGRHVSIDLMPSPDPMFDTCYRR